MLACNLADQVRRLAARRAGVEPRRLSFAGVWGLLKAFVAGLREGRSAAEAEATFERLRASGNCRGRGRACPREVIPRRRKSPERKRARPPS